ncbi:MAG: glycogen-binding domain-containing protein [Spirochaetales bacterium]|nr:glycogen-binding domain-containing protein [Spirochaetales bacterium]
MKNLKYILFTTLFLFSVLSLWSAEKEKNEFAITSFSLHLRITEMTDSEQPFIVGNDLIFTYKPSKKFVRHVGISFGNENFSEVHNMYKNEHGIYFFIYEFPKDKIINYKFVEDGVWISDAKNSKSVTDKNFISLSVFEVPDKNIKEHITPIISDRNVTFRIKSTPGNSIYLTGDFNSWNPFLYKLEEREEGIYYLDLKLPKGKYGYYYIINGNRVLDFENPETGISQLGEKVSLFVIK